MSFLTDEIRNRLPENSLVRRLDEGKTENLVDDCRAISAKKIDKRIKTAKESILERLRGK